MIVNPATSRAKFSVLLILLKHKPVSVLFELHPTLTAFLLSQLSDRNTCFCAQITTVLTRLVVNLYAEVGRENKAEWLRMCIAPIVDTIFSSREGCEHAFNYVLPALLDIKPNFLSAALREEKARCKEAEGVTLFSLDSFFLQEAARRSQDEETAAMLRLKVITLEKELGLWGRDGSCYVGEGAKKLNEVDVLRYAGSGSVDIGLALMDLISATSCVGVGGSVECSPRRCCRQWSGAWCAASSRTASSWTVRASATTWWCRISTCAITCSTRHMWLSAT